MAITLDQEISLEKYLIQNCTSDCENTRGCHHVEQFYEINGLEE